ncbi:hypothetical protein C447_03391 [Halococcus hamelinensis 100A6]|uniref:Uncharacterized protein n=1 Tax=Halococcus hamelinensis 100A6 TaxID=1132509 RepID=M0M526_9EURY|nr:hypothetical protein C447_03391 [Halococcus hamelinensis 100A6]
MLTIAYVNGPVVFERPSLRDDVEATKDLEKVIDDKDRVLTSLKYTRLLNDLAEEDGYLDKTFQGGVNPIVIDWEYDEGRDIRSAAPFGYKAALDDIVTQVLSREGKTKAALGSVDRTDFNAVVKAVNGAVGRNVLGINSDPSRYRFAKGVHGLTKNKVEEALERNEDD